MNPKATPARRHLPNHIGANEAEMRRRFISALRDDSLQLLTAAELQLERVHVDPRAAAHQAAQLDALKVTLRELDDSFRRLIANVGLE